MASLLKELRALTEDEFNTALIKAAGENVAAPKKKSTTTKRTQSAPKDAPITRIAHVLRVSRGLSDLDAQRWLACALIKDGVDASLIPEPSTSVPIEAWLERLLQSVRSAVVFDVASAGLAR